jgi:hypothetical protein
MDAKLRQFVRQRASHRCEYCQLPQLASPYLSFHIEHIQAQQHVLDDSPANLALACPDCNFHKRPNLTTLDLLSREVVVLFHPRKDRWEDHFEYQGAIIVGRTRIGEATIRLLQMNTGERVEMRSELLASGDLYSA